MNLADLTGSEAARLIADGVVRCEELMRACLARVEEVDGEIEAWTHLDPDYALEQARNADEARAGGAPVGPLHGVPVGVKDIFDTQDMPTENGTPLMAGRRPNQDATAVSLLRQAGAIVMGKTVTTELAMFSPGKTRNPHDRTRTPGGSSSGSAAAVAAGMAPLSIGSQTAGSVIRPASFCGVYGYKPTHGTISRHGVLRLSRTLDTVGVFARSVEDLALLGDCMTAYDEHDPDMAPASRAQLRETAMADPPLAPIFAFVKSPAWDEAGPETVDGFAEITDFLGDACDSVDLPELFDRGLEWHRTVMVADLAKSLEPLYQRGKEQISPVLREMIEEGQAVRAVDYNKAVEWIEVLNAGLDQIFERYDAILTPATTGQAPEGLDRTGSPVFCSLWTLCGTPSVSLPVLEGPDGLPMGVQLVGRRGDDGRLLRTARSLVETMAGSAADEE